MAQLDEAFDPNSVEPSAPMEDLPPGEYTAEIIEAVLKDTKSNDGGKLIVLSWRVVDPEEFANRRIWQNINWRNKNAQAQEIGRRDLSAVCHAGGVSDHLQDTDQLVGLVCNIVVRMGTARNGYPAKTEVKGWKAVNAAPPAQTARPTASAQPPRSAAPAQRPAATAGNAPGAARPAGARPWGNRQTA